MLAIGRLFSYIEQQTRAPEKKLEQSLKKNEMPSSWQVMGYSVPASTLGILITLFLLVLLRVVLEIFSQ